VAGAVLVDFGRPGGGGPVPCRGVRPRGAAHGWIHRLVGSCSCVSPLVRLWFPACPGAGGWKVVSGGGGCLARCWVLEERAVPTHTSHLLSRVVTGGGCVWGSCVSWGPFVPQTARLFVPAPRGVGVGAVVGVGCAGGFPWFLENCIVDASIFVFVVKFLRAHGGCLGIRSR
jgi:hypothetical protein